MSDTILHKLLIKVYNINYDVDILYHNRYLKEHEDKINYFITFFNKLEKYEDNLENIKSYKELLVILLEKFNKETNNNNRCNFMVLLSRLFSSCISIIIIREKKDYYNDIIEKLYVFKDLFTKWDMQCHLLYINLSLHRIELYK